MKREHFFEMNIRPEPKVCLKNASLKKDKQIMIVFFICLN